MQRAITEQDVMDVQLDSSMEDRLAEWGNWTAAVIDDDGDACVTHQDGHKTYLNDDQQIAFKVWLFNNHAPYPLYYGHHA